MNTELSTSDQLNPKKSFDENSEGTEARVMSVSDINQINPKRIHSNNDKHKMMAEASVMPPVTFDRTNHNSIR